MKTKVKICGITSEEEVYALVENNVDYLGIVLFFPKSKRNVSIEQAKNIIDKANELSSGYIKKVAVVVSPTIEQLEEIVSAGFDIVQIHKDIPNNIEDIFVCAPHFKMWKAYNGTDLESMNYYMGKSFIDGFLFDAAEPGSGKVFDWQQLVCLSRGDKKLILAGGLTSDNVVQAIKTVKPDIVDVSSGVEYDCQEEIKLPYLKDFEKIKNFSKNAKKSIDIV